MAEEDGERDLWGDAWSHVAKPDEDALIPRDLWSPAARRAETWHPPTGDKPPRRHAEVGGRDSHLTFDPPPAHRPRPEQPAGRDRRKRPVHAPSHPEATRAERAPSPERATSPGRTKRPERSAARSLAPRGTVVGYRRSGGRLTLILIAVLAVVILALAIWWFATRPAALAITPSPADATVTVVGHGSRTGTFTLSGIGPGSLTAVVTRAGYETATLTVDVERGQSVKRAVALVPRPFKLKVTSRPSGAAVTLTRTDGSRLTGTTPCSLISTAGAATLSIARSGCNTFSQALFVDAARNVDVLLDPKGQVVHALGSLTAKGAPKSVAVTPNGREAWAAILNGPPSIEIYDLKTMRKVGGIDIGKHGAVEVIFNRAGTRAYASQMETAKVFEIDTATRKVLRSFKTQSAWTKVVALSPDEKTVYAANWSGNDVSVISLTTGKLVKRVPVAKTPRGLWPTADGRYLFVAGFDAGDLERIDLRSWHVKKVFHSGGAMRHLVADESTGKLYASDMAKDVVWVTDMATLKTRKFCDTDEKPNTIALSPDGKVLFISNRGENNPVSYYLKGYEWGTVLLMSTADGKPLDAIVGGNQCTALAVSADGHTLVFSDFLDDRLRVYGVPAFDVLAKGGGGRFAAHFQALKKTRP